MKVKVVVLALITFALLSYALYLALAWSPMIAVKVRPGADPDRMSNIFRIFYYHVPSAATAFICFGINVLASVWYLVRRNPKMDALAVSSAEVGLAFCTVVLITGPIWAKPVWGIWWTWDARLTSTLVLWLIYVSYLILRRYSTGGQMPVLAAVLAVFGAVDTVFVVGAIRWFRTQHPQPVFERGSDSIFKVSPPMLHTILTNLAAFLVFAGLVLWLRYRLERARQQFEEQQAMASLAARSSQ
jgi:heme exporter protein C